jgi:hypothetical protein
VTQPFATSQSVSIVTVLSGLANVKLAVAVLTPVTRAPASTRPLEAGLAVKTTLEPCVVGGFDQGVGFRIFEPAVAEFSIQPAGEFMGRVVKRHREALPCGVEDGGGCVGGDYGRDVGGVALVERIFVEKGTRAVFRDMSAGRAGFVEAGEEGVLALAAFDLLNAGGLVLFQVGALVPDAGEGVVAALADGPDDNRDGLVGPLEINRRVVETGARHEE